MLEIQKQLYTVNIDKIMLWYIVIQFQVMEDFQRINREMNITILLNIHHVELALTYASRVVGIRAGQIVYDGPVSDVNEEILNNIYEGKLEQEVAG